MDWLRLLLLRCMRWCCADRPPDAARRGRGGWMLDEADPRRGIIARF
jgi:hypothetical protein